MTDLERIELSAVVVVLSDGIALCLAARAGSTTLSRACAPRNIIHSGVFETQRLAYFVRHPLDRLVSQWLLHNEIERQRRVGVDTLDQFIDALVDAGGNPHYMSLTQTFTDKGTGQVVVPDFLGRFETLDDDWLRFRRWCGWHLPYTLHNQNPSQRQPGWRHYLTADQEARARRILAADLDRWYA